MGDGVGVGDGPGVGVGEGEGNGVGAGDVGPLVNGAVGAAGPLEPIIVMEIPV